MQKSATRRPAWLGSAPGTPPANKDRTFPPEPLTAAEANALIAACSPTSTTGRRNRALLTLLYRAGPRVSEALALKVSDVDPVRGTVRILHGKGNKPRTIPIDHGTMAVLQRWIDARRSAGIRNGLLFCTLEGGPLDARYARALLARLAAKAGIEKRVHPHGLRHTYAVELVADGVPVTAIQKLLGHADLKVTSVYLDHLTPAELATFVQQRTWEEPK
jgi:integrase/recombinase XerD